jgi:hypothetical protein
MNTGDRLYIPVNTRREVEVEFLDEDERERVARLHIPATWFSENTFSTQLVIYMWDNGLKVDKIKKITVVSSQVKKQ